MPTPTDRATQGSAAGVTRDGGKPNGVRSPGLDTATLKVSDAESSGRKSAESPGKSADSSSGEAAEPSSGADAGKTDGRDEIVTSPSSDCSPAVPVTRVTRVKNGTMKYCLRWVALVACVVLASAGGFVTWRMLSGGPDTGAAAAVREFASALSRKDAAAAAQYTTAPGQAADALTQTVTAMNPDSIDVNVDKPEEYSDGTASFNLRTTWRWDKDRSYESATSGTARHLSSGWKVTWDPTVIAQGLPVGGNLREIRTDATPAPTVNSVSGKPFMILQPVNEIVLDPSKTRDVAGSVRALSRTLAPIAPLITPEVINAKLAATPNKPIVAVTLRDSDMGVMNSSPAAIPGVSINKTDMLVMADRRLSSPLEPALTNYWQAIRDATAGWQVQMVGPGLKPRKLAGEQGPPGPDVATSINQQVQLTLGDAAVEVGQPATIMALDAQSGAILGLAQNDYAVERKNSVDQAYPVGATLDPVFAAVDKGTSSNKQSSNKQSSDTALDRLGLGVGFTVPGASTPTTPQSGVATIDYRPQSATASMLNMAALGVSMARVQAGTGSSVAPTVIKGAATKVDGGALGAIDKSVSSPILSAMTTTAKTGDASDLTQAPGLKALVGTNGPQGPGWFVGIQGGKVIVIYTEGEKSGTAALQVAQKYFRIA